jgi:uncharacterized protein YbbC (DUF1343 family)
MLRLTLTLITALMLQTTTGSTFQIKNFRTSVPDPKKVDTRPLEKVRGKLMTGAEQIDQYLPYLKGKRIGMVVNPTSVIGNTTVTDSLLALGIKIVKIFGPEHGFRGDASAGVKVDNSFDKKTGLPVISLYGKHLKPTKRIWPILI